MKMTIGAAVVAVGMAFGVRASAADVTWRVGGGMWMKDENFAQFTDLLEKHKVRGKIAMFIATGHSPGKLELLKEQIDVLKVRCAQLRARGFRAGPNILCTIGQGKEALDLQADVPGAQFLVGAKGDVSCCRHCLRDPVWREKYVKPLYEMLAKAGPDFIWMDDDMRLIWNDVPGPACFCPRCLGLMKDRLGFTGTHADLAAFFADEKEGDKRRRGLLDLNREAFADMYAFVERTVHAVDPRIQMGMMDGGRGPSWIDGHGYDTNAKALSPKGEALLCRPGGGFYRESDTLESMVGKANGVGYECAWLPDFCRPESEIELHPKSMLYKSRATLVNESLVYIVAGATGTAWNFFPNLDEEFAEAMLPQLDAAVAAKRKADAFVAAAGRARPRGVWSGYGRYGFAGNRCGGRNGEWFELDWDQPGFEGSELQWIGIPVAYREEDADVIAPNAPTVWSWTDEEAKRYLARGLYLADEAVAALVARGYGEYVGFTVGEELSMDAVERYAEHPLNARIAGKIRTSCASFLKGRGHALVPQKGATVVASAEVHGKTVAPCVAGTFVNKLGGRIYANGFFPFARMAQMTAGLHFKRAFRWLSDETLSGEVASYHRAAMWVRGDLAAVVNMSIDEVTDMEILLRGEKWAGGIRELGVPDAPFLKGTREGAYTRYRLPCVKPWGVAAYARADASKRELRR